MMDFIANYGFLILFLVLMCLRMPIAFSLGVSSAFYFIMSGTPFITMAAKLVETFGSFTLLAIPLFMLAGFLMNSGGVTSRMFHFAQVCVGHIPGGLGQVNVISSLIFAGMSGSATADAGGLGVIEIEAMKKEGYDAAFSAATTAATSVVATIMPPSLGFVIYGAMTGVSVGKLFLAGVLPAFVITAAQMLVVYRAAKKKGFPIMPKATRQEKWVAFKAAFLPLMAPVIMLASITFGFVTPTEAAVLAVLYSILLGIIYKELTFKKFVQDLVGVGKTCGKVMLIVAFASVFGWILTYERIPAMLASALLSVSTNPIIVLLIVNAMLLVMGCFMEGLSIQLITIPILLPLLQTAGVNLLQFGVLMELNLNIGLITPPVGVFIYLCADIAKTSFEKVTKELVPFIVILIVVILILILIPQISTFLPGLLMG